MTNSSDLKMPVHVTIIMDGNGRWARQHGMERLFGHNNGVESVRECCQYAVENGIKYLSIFAFSEENWGRPQSEVEGLMHLMLTSVLGELPVFMENNVKFRTIGDRSKLPGQVVEAIEKVENATAANTGLTFIVMLSYSGKWDIRQAAEKYAADCLAAGKQLELSEEKFSSYLATAGIPDPDLLIRTSGEERISNYMLWQNAYTEFYFTPVLWPDFRKKDLEDAVRNFNERERRFGKVK